MPISELVCATAIAGDASTLTAAKGQQLGRALGTLARRHTARARRGNIVVACEENSSDVSGRDVLRDGIVRGLILSGHDVKELAATTRDLFAFALDHLDAAAAVLVAGGDTLSLTFFLGRSLVSVEDLQALAQLADGEDFAAGEGTLELVDVRTAFRARRNAAIEPRP